MSAPPKEEEAPKTIEELNNEIKTLKTQLKAFKEEVMFLKMDKQMKEFKINIIEERLNTQDQQINKLHELFMNSIQNKGGVVMPEEPPKKEETKKQEPKKVEPKKEEKKVEEEQIDETEPDDEKIKLTFKKDITTDAPNYSGSSQMFCVFKSLKGEAILSWVTKKNTIELYDLEKESHMKTIKDAHTNDIQCCRHFVDTKTNTDLLITASYDKSLKIWNIEKMESPILSIENAHFNGFIFTPCILSHEKLKENYVISGADDVGIKIFDFNGKFLGKQINLEEYVNFLDTYYDKNKDKFYIINGSSKNLKVYNFEDCSVYQVYRQKENSAHAQILIHENKNNDQVQLIDADMKGFIQIWDFHTGECLKTIIMKTIVNGICLWDDKYLISTGRDKQIKVVNLKRSKIIKTLGEHNKESLAVQKIHISKYGDCLISHGKDGVLKLWSL